MTASSFSPIDLLETEVELELRRAFAGCCPAAPLQMVGTGLTDQRVEADQVTILAGQLDRDGLHERTGDLNRIAILIMLEVEIGQVEPFGVRLLTPESVLHQCNPLLFGHDICVLATETSIGVEVRQVGSLDQIG